MENSLLLLGLLLICCVVRSAHGVSCQQCTNTQKGCDERPNFLARCPNDTTLCFVRFRETRSFERGCLTPTNSGRWKECEVEKSNYCFTCIGDDCNHMEIATRKSRQYCMRCDGVEECNAAREAERCPNADTLFGPTQCTSRYSSDGTTIVLKDCWRHVDQSTTDFQENKHLYFNCLGQMCNFQSQKAVHRCRRFIGNTQLNQTKIHNCYLEDRWDRVSVIMGCFTRVGLRTQLVDGKVGPKTQIYAACNTRHDMLHLAKCMREPMCQLCYGNLCNDNMPTFFKFCYNSTLKTTTICKYAEDMCFINQKSNKMGCVAPEMPGLYHPDTLMCNNDHRSMCQPTVNIPEHMGCYECSHPPCDDVLVTLGYTAKTICPLGTTRCYSSRRSDGVTFRGCYSGSAEGVKVCKDTLGACRLCTGNYCNYHKLVDEWDEGQCYKSNWRRIDVHETSLRLADCRGNRFHGTTDRCYIASSSRLFMRLGCLSELVAGIDDTYAITTGPTSVTWLYQNTCYKCESHSEDYCYDVQYLEQHTCLGLNKLPVRGCYTLIDRRARRLERGCITELSEYMLRLCNMPIFFEKCSICQESGCNKDVFNGFV